MPPRTAYSPGSMTVPVRRPVFFSDLEDDGLMALAVDCAAVLAFHGANDAYQPPSAAERQIERLQNRGQNQEGEVSLARLSFHRSKIARMLAQVVARGEVRTVGRQHDHLDRVVGADRQALTRADTGLVVDLGQHLLVHRHSNGVGRADADTGQARDAELGVDREIQRSGPSGGG